MKSYLKKASARFQIPLTLFLFIPATTFATPVVPFTLTGALLAGDDESTGPVSLAIGGAGGIDFFGQSFKTVYVNDNGNVTFQLPVSTFTPASLAAGIGIPIIAPFFADVDTGGSGSITYGNATYNGHAAFVADWLNVGYFDSHADKLNSFQLILTDRSDTGAGNFDIEFNYDLIKWETGDASGGVNGFGGVSAAAGYSNGLSGTSNVFYQLPGSLLKGAFLNSGPDTLVAQSLNSTTPGRYDFQVRNSQVIASTPEPVSITLFAVGLITMLAAKKTRVR